MKSMTLTTPSAVSKRVSRIVEPSRYARVTRTSPATGAIRQRPWSGVPSRAAKQAGLSKRGMPIQSIEPSRATSATVSWLPISA